MIAEFIQIESYRIRKSTIKSYKPQGNLQINLYFSVSQTKVDVKIIPFYSVRARNLALKNLDKQFLNIK